MKKSNLSVLLLGAALFVGLGAVSVSASDMKCGAGKCGASMEKPAKKCGVSKKCGASMEKAERRGPGGISCGGSMEKAAKKCGASKKATAKCGAGKCGSK